MREIMAGPLTVESFRPFGDVIEISGQPSFQFNDGNCDRFHDLARVEVVGSAARLGLSMARCRAYTAPFEVSFLERHPLGSQAFVPLSTHPFLIGVAEDDGGQPGPIRAFVSKDGQGVNYLRNIWHMILTPLVAESDFLIVDYVGPEKNLVVRALDEPVQIVGVDQILQMSQS